MENLRRFVSFLQMLYHNNYMIRSMVARDMRARYVGSLLGFFWSVIHPLSQILVYYFIFGFVIKMRLGPEYGGTHFALWLIAGLLPWLFFAGVVTGSPGVVVGKSMLIKKVVFPSEIFPVVQLMVAIVNHLIGLSIFFLFLVISGGDFSIKIVMILPYLFLVVVFSLGVSWFLSALNVFLRDIGQIIGVAVNIWFFLTPILYVRHMIPESLQWLFGLNPILHVVEGYRMALLGKTEMDIAGLSYLLLWSLFMFVLGALTFKKLKPGFADAL